MPIRKWFEKYVVPTRTRRVPAPAPRVRMGVESLEDRVVPAMIVEIEMNNSAAAAQVVAVPVGDVVTTAPADWLTIRGNLAGTDTDFFQFTVAARSGVFFDIDSQETGLSGTLDTSLTLFAPNGATVLATNNDGYDFEGYALDDGDPLNGIAPNEANPSADSSLYFDLDPGTYFVQVSRAGAGIGDYDLRILADATYSTAPPVLNSLPTAADTLYLDFDGHASGTDRWAIQTNGGAVYTATAFNLDANAGVFSPAERLAIANVFRVVAEDFSPFNINVTTVDPGAFPDRVAFRQVITNSSAGIVDPTIPAGVIGLAWLNSYGGTSGPGDTDSIAFTFAGPPLSPNGFGGGTSGAIGPFALELANVSSHEFGHALGLNHYRGSPLTMNPADVIPGVIMTDTSNGAARARFVSGNADNGSMTGAAQDDLAVIGNAVNSFGLRADDHGDNPANATAILQTGLSTYAGTGVIRSLSDPDFFSFVAGGDTTIRVDVDDFSTNLDVVLRLFDAAGNQIGMPADPTGSPDASIVRSGVNALPAGTYFISVRSQGGVGEVGQYRVDITTSVSLAPVVTTSPGRAMWIKDGPAVLVDPDVTVTDIDDTELVGATVQITGGYVSGQDVLSLPNGTGVLSFFDALSGTLTLFGETTVADYQNALRQVTYTNTAANPTTGTRILTIRADDGILPGAGATREVSVSIAPVLLTTNPATQYTEGTPVAVDASVTLSDGDSLTLESATVRITGGYLVGEDVLTFTPDITTGALIGAFNPASGALTLTTPGGMPQATIAQYQAALRLVQYTNTSDAPTSGARVVSFVATDGIAPGPQATKTVGITPVNDPPANTVPAGPLATAEDVGLAITGISVADPDAGPNVIRVTLSVTAGSLTVSTGIMNGVTAAQVLGNGTNTVVLTAPIAAVNATLAATVGGGAGANGLVYVPTADVSGSDMLTVTTTDLGSTGGSPTTDTDTVALTVTTVNDDPVAVSDNLAPVVVNSGPRTISFASLLGNDRTGPANESAQALTLIGVANPVGGTVAISGGAVQFTPAANFTGTASFFYTIQDNGTTNGAADPKTATGQVSFEVTAAPPAPPAPPGGSGGGSAGTPAGGTAFYTGAEMVSPTTLVLRGAGVPGGEQALTVPAGTAVFFADLSGDGKGDVILFLPNLFVAVDGATGRFLVLATDDNGDGARDLLIFNPDNTTTRIDGRTGIALVR